MPLDSERHASSPFANLRGNGDLRSIGSVACSNIRQARKIAPWAIYRGH